MMVSDNLLTMRWRYIIDFCSCENKYRSAAGTNANSRGVGRSPKSATKSAHVQKSYIPVSQGAAARDADCARVWFQFPDLSRFRVYAHALAHAFLQGLGRLRAPLWRANPALPLGGL